MRPSFGPASFDRRKAALAAAGAVGLAVVLFVSCGGCGRSRRTGEGASAPEGSSSAAAGAKEAPRARVDERMWALAREGQEEDLAALAVHEGAAGLVEATADPSLRPTAVRAMAFAPGWAQLPYLAGVAGGGPEAEAKAALAVIVDLAARPRRAEDPEDAAELAVGCEKLLSLAGATDKDRGRRIPAIRALRMMPCPKAELPTDLDAR